MKLNCSFAFSTTVGFLWLVSWSRSILNSWEYIYTNYSLYPKTGHSSFGTPDLPDPGSNVSELLGAKVSFPGFDTNNLLWDQGHVSRKSRELVGPEKPFVKLRPAYSVKLVFSYVVKGIKIKITAKFRSSRRLRFEDTKRIMSPEIRQKTFGTFEKQAPDVRLFGELN